MDWAVNPESIPGEFDSLKKRLSRVEQLLDENTQITREVRDALIAGRVLAKLVAWVAPIAAFGAASWVWLKDHAK